jgi:DNA-binding PadR family transcriptional regulator
MPREALGELEHRVMLAILRLGGEAYSLPVVQEIETRTGRKVAQSAVFIAMRRLEGKGLLSSRLEEMVDGRPDRVRRHYRPTPAGMAMLRNARRDLVSLWEGIETLVEDA